MRLREPLLRIVIVYDNWSFRVEVPASTSNYPAFQLTVQYLTSRLVNGVGSGVAWSVVPLPSDQKSIEPIDQKLSGVVYNLNGQRLHEGILISTVLLQILKPEYLQRFQKSCFEEKLS